MSKRTTEALIEKAIAACTSAGIEIGAVEVETGGRVRILARGAMPRVEKGTGGNTCDALFPAPQE
jgi:hypothetical protein